MSDDIIFNKLNNQRDAILREIMKLQAKLEVIDEILNEGSNVNSTSSDITINDNAIKPKDAIISIFDNEPQKLFYSKDIRAKLEDLRKEGNLDSNAKNIRYMMYGVLKILTDEEYIEKLGSGINSRYRKYVETPKITREDIFS